MATLENLLNLIYAEDSQDITPSKPDKHSVNYSKMKSLIDYIRNSDEIEAKMRERWLEYIRMQLNQEKIPGITLQENTSLYSITNKAFN